MRATADQVRESAEPSQYFVQPGFIQALGLRLVEGRDMTGADVMESDPEKDAEAIPPGRAGRVRVTASVTGEEVELSVSDNGNGISEENREKIFEPLFTSKPRGTGLGLAIVSSVVARHNGTMDVKSREGVGTTFTIRLPRRPPGSVRPGR